MKKILSYILITVIISANLLAPISFSFSKNNSAKVKANVAEAAGVHIKTFFGLTTGRTVQANISVIWATPDINVDKSFVYFYIYKEDKTTIQEPPQKVSAKNLEKLQDGYLGSVTFSSNIESNTVYYIKAMAYEKDNNGDSSMDYTTMVRKETVGESVNQVNVLGESALHTNSSLPVCWKGWTSGFSVYGCFAQFLYYAVFTPASALFAIGGVFFDYTFHYALQSSTYKTPFVNQGWKLIRDFANMFFIFILLYIAFGTILDLNGFKTKEMIVNVIIIGLLINFSLFTARLVIDTSNILARVFYNSNTVKITKIKGLDVTKIITGPGKAGILPLSSAVVNKVNPQRLVQNVDKAGTLVTDKGEKGDVDFTKGTEKTKGIGTGTFIIITLLAAAVSIVGFIVFLSVGLVFVGRVIGLWIAMILAPLAFFTYTVPAMRNIEMLGWKRWWPNLLKLSFLAPVFMFFLYLIIQFLQIGLGLGDASSKKGLDYVLTVTLPFIFIMILLWQAKKIATKMSGQFGEAMTKAGATVGGIALGAASGGVAFALRNTAGRLAKRGDENNWINDAAAGKKGKGKQFIGRGLKNISSFGKQSSFDLRKTKASDALSKHTSLDLNKASMIGLGTKSGEGGYEGKQLRKKAKEEEFASSLGYDKKLYEETEDKIKDQEKEIKNKKKEKIDIENELRSHKATKPVDSGNNRKGLYRRKMDAYNKKLKKISDELGEKNKLINELENGTGKDGQREGVEKMNKDLQRIKEGRKNEYIESVRKRSGRIITEETQRDDNENIKRFARYGKVSGKRAIKQLWAEFGKGFLKGAGAGATAGVPGGLPTMAAGAVGGGLINGVRHIVLNYSGTTNRSVGGEVQKKEIDK